MIFQKHLIMKQIEKKESFMSEKQIEYSVFCIENVAERLGKTGTEIFNLLNNSGLLKDYIFPSYEALHFPPGKNTSLSFPHTIHWPQHP